MFLNGNDDTLGTKSDDFLKTYRTDSLRKSSYDKSIQVDSSTSAYLMIVSDLQVGSSSDPNMDLSRQMLFDFVCGRLGGTKDKDIASRISR